MSEMDDTSMGMKHSGMETKQSDDGLDDGWYALHHA